MKWAIYRVPPGTTRAQRELVGYVEGTTYADAIRLAKAEKLIVDDGGVFGIEMVGPSEDDQARPLSSMSIGDLASMLGIVDVIATRQQIQADRAKTAEALKATEMMLRDVEGVRSVNARERLTCAHDVEVFATAAKNNLNDAPGHVLILLLAWADEHGNYTSTPHVVN